jgi:hypothetical protein
MRYRLRTLLTLTTAVCVFFGWNAYLRQMAAYHREKAKEEMNEIFERPESYPGKNAFQLHIAAEHYRRASDFDHALLRPWLAFVHCEPGSTFGAPVE